MKKLKLIVPVLTILMILCPAFSVHAEPREAKFNSGAEEGKITFRIWDLQTLEGKVSVKALDGGEIHLESISAVTNDKNNTEICDTSGNKVFMVSNGTPVKTTITVSLSFVEDGTYLVTLSGGCTNNKGKYNASGLYEEKKIIVGAPNVEEEEENVTTETVNPQAVKPSNTETVARPNAVTGNKEDNTTIVRKEEESEDVISENRVIDEILKDAEDVIKEAEKEKKSVNALGNILRILLSVLGLIALAVGGFFLYRYEKKRKQDYDGAPDIDYIIEEDD